MPAEIVTTEDLIALRIQLLDEIKKLLSQTHTSENKKWLKSPDVRKMLNISPGTLQNLRVNGTLSYTKIGGLLFYSYEDIVKLLEQNKIQNQPLTQ